MRRIRSGQARLTGECFQPAQQVHQVHVLRLAVREVSRGAWMSRSRMRVELGCIVNPGQKLAVDELPAGQ